MQLVYPCRRESLRIYSTYLIDSPHSEASRRPYVRREVKPGPDTRDEAALLDFCRNNGATIFHPSGTCAMGSDPATGAVVDARLRVHGLAGIRVVDCSAMPTLVSGNTNAAAVMMAEKAADMVRADARQHA